MSKLLELPDELKVAILELIVRPSDLKNLCLTNKSLHGFAVPLLYRTVILRVFQLDDNLQQSLLRNNPGVVHTRELRIKEHVNDDKYDAKRHEKPLARLIRALPEHALETLDLAMAHGGSVITYLTLLTQNRLQNIRIRHLSEGPLSPLLPLREGFDRVSSLSVFLDSEGDVLRTCGIFQALPRLENLKTTVDYDASEDVGLTFLRKLVALRTKLKLKKLLLENFEINENDPQLADAIETSSLEELSFVDCEFSRGILERFTGENFGSLKSFTNNDVLPGCPDHMLWISSFLRSIKGLLKLRITLPFEEPTSVGIGFETIQPHAATMRSFLIDEWNQGTLDTNYHSFGQNVVAFRKFCVASQHLKELAMTSVVNDFDTSTNASSFTAFLDCLQQLPMLTTLRLFTYPESLIPELEHGQVRYACRAVVAVGIQNLANKIFSSLHKSCPKFKALQIDARAELHPGWDGPHVMKFGFLKVIQTDIYGNTTIVGNAVEPDLIHYDEPCSEVLKDTVTII